MADEPLDNEQLVAAIEQHESTAENFGEVQRDRVRSLEYYLGEPMGDEIDGRSQVISRDVYDTLEWIKPQLADIFCSGDEVVSFSPRGPEDEASAAQETDYVNYTITQRNNWFDIWNCWSHDALLQKNGYVKCYWDDSIDTTKERYQGLSDEEFRMLLADDSITLIEHMPIQVLGGTLPMTVHDAVFERAKGANIVRVDNVAPENILVSQNARKLSLQDPRLDFLEHRERKTLSQLRAEGFEVDDDLSDGGEAIADWEENYRDEDTPFRDLEGLETDPSMRLVMTREVWIRYDHDGDGIAELRNVVLVGTTVLKNEPCEVVNVVALCPYILPHRHYGLSLADAVMDLQKIKTALLRAGLDNQYLANNGRYAVNAETVNLDDMLDSRAGGIVRVDGSPGAEIFPLTHPTNATGAVAMMQYIDTVMSKRTGVNEQSQGLDQNTLNQTFGGAQLLLTAAQQRIKFIARVFAETGVKSLFQVVHALTLMHSRGPEIMRLRNTWVPVDPRQWFKRSDMQISVALGAGDKPQQMAFLTQTLGMQMQSLAGGLTDKTRIYNTLARMARIGGYKDPGEFWIDPTTAPPPPPVPPPPEVMVAQMKQAHDTQLVQMKQAHDAQMAQFEAQTKERLAQVAADLKLAEKRAELELQATNDLRDAERQQTQGVIKAELERAQIASDRQIAELNAGIEKYKADLNARVQLATAHGGSGATGFDAAQFFEPDPMMLSLVNQQGVIASEMSNLAAQNRTAMESAVQQISQLSGLVTAAVQEMGKPRSVRVVRDANGKIAGAQSEGT